MVDSFFDIFYEIEFTQVGGSGPPLVLTPAVPVQVQLQQPVPFSHAANPLSKTVVPGDFDPLLGTSNFFVGGDQLNPAAPYQTFIFVNQGGGMSVQFVTATVPEPASLALALLGLLAIPLFRRRRYSPMVH